MEIKNVLNYKGEYKVSESGVVISYKNKITKILKPAIDRGGYLKVCLCMNSKKETKLIHILVAESFLNHKPDKHNKIVDHKDNDKLNNHKDNLQITTSRHNLSKDKKNKTSKFTGVSWSKAVNKWHARIYKNGKLIHLGFFKDEKQASDVYQKNRPLCE